MSAIAAQALTVVSGRGVTRLVQLGTFVLLARFLSPSDFGWYAIITTAIYLAALLGNLGLRQSLAYWIGQNRMTAGEASATAIAVWPVLATASTAVVVVFAGAGPEVDFATVAWTLGISVSSAMMISLLQGVNLGRGQLTVFTLAENLPRTLLMAGTMILFALALVTLETVLWTQAISYALTVPVLLWYTLRGAGRLHVRPRMVLPMIGYGLIFALNLFALMLGARLSMFVLEAHFGAEAAGQFFAAVRVNEILLEVAAALGMVLFSHAARQEQSLPTIRRNARISCWMFWLFAAGAIIIVWAAPLVLVLLAGPQYESAGPALQVLAIGLAPAAAAKLIYPTLAGTGHPYFGTPAILVSLAVNFGLAAVLVPPWGLIGGALALVCGQFLLFASYVVVCCRRFEVPVRDFLLPYRSDLKLITTSTQGALKRGVRFARK